MTTETGNKSGAASVTSNAEPSSLSVRASVAKHTPDGHDAQCEWGAHKERCGCYLRAENAALLREESRLLRKVREQEKTTEFSDGLIVTMREERAALRAQRDELAAALRQLERAATEANSWLFTGYKQGHIARQRSEELGAAIDAARKAVP